MNTPAPLVSIVIVVRNQADQVDQLMPNLLQQDYPNLEIIFVDSISEDETRARAERFRDCQSKVPIRCLANHRRILAPGWNVGFQGAAGAFIQRIDGAHCRLPTNYISACVSALVTLQESDPSIMVVGGRRATQPGAKTEWARAIAAAQESRFGVGNAAYRLATRPGRVPTLGMGLYDRRVFERVGWFDESLVRAEDQDIHGRIRAHGYHLYLQPDIVADYFARPTLRTLAQQMYGNGFWVGFTAATKPGNPFGVRNFVPALCLLAAAADASMALLDRAYLVGGAVAILAYLSLGMLFASKAARHRGASRFMVVVVFALMHVAQGAGTLRGVVQGCWERRESLGKRQTRRAE